ncbi:hypothetical protein CDD81_907 [Ophiocordyceps australis]|uniref:Uncharacterized protein n=1 Tax=Ophiocordyceps australis TaxID=1399860 RepID=A0A2C5XBD2_9HYPO|nr:hypothetical protein CDD81_907 [Ophiocordyceps australis]
MLDLLRLTSFRSPLLRTLVPSVAAAFALQACVAVPSVAAQSERFYDVSGSATVLAVGALSLYLPALRARAAGEPVQLAFWHMWRWWSLRQVLVTGLAAVWTLRLGSYLFARILAHGHDSRFDSLRSRPPAFFAAFMAQAAWVSAMLAPVIALNAVPPSVAPALLVSDVLGLALWAAGFGLEVAADAQKSKWAQAKRRKEHDQDFLSSGLFAWCRFPNYLGEITLWSGIATIAAGALAQRPVQRALGFPSGPRGILATTALSFFSPVFSAYLITQVSGVPLTEQIYDERYGHRKDYKQWRHNTPRLLPKIF